MMFEYAVGNVILVENNESVDIVIARDPAIEPLAEKGAMNPFESDVDLEKITAADAMTANPFSANDDKLLRVLHHLDEAHARRIPGVNDKEELVGSDGSSDWRKYSRLSTSSITLPV